MDADDLDPWLTDPTLPTEPRERGAYILEHRTDLITEMITKAVALAIWEHYQAGVPIVISENGRVVEVPASEIPARMVGNRYWPGRADLLGRTIPRPQGDPPACDPLQ